MALPLVIWRRHRLAVVDGWPEDFMRAHALVQDADDSVCIESEIVLKALDKLDLLTWV